MSRFCICQARERYTFTAILFTISCVMALFACQSTDSSTIATPLVSGIPTPTLIATDDGELTPEVQATHSSDIEPDSGWEQLRPGLERRIINVTNREGAFREKLYLMRIDPTLYRFDVAYHPGTPQSMTQWQNETGALVILNGGFFTEANLATGLIVVNGKPFGISYEGFGGMLVITNGGPKIRSLLEQPYDPSELLLAGLQSFPILVQPGGQHGFADENSVPARRSVIAQDRDGRIIFLLATTGTFSLTELSKYLLESHLNLHVALNLDGGGSTGVLVAEPLEGIAPYTLLPVVITVYAK